MAAPGQRSDGVRGLPTLKPRESSIRVGVCGLGFIGPVHIEILRRIRNATVSGVSSREPGRAEAIADRFGIPRSYTNHEDLIADPAIDVVHICTTNRSHARLTKMAMEAGKHVLCEKPLATTAEEGRALATLAAERGGVYAVNHQYRYYPMIQQARAMIRNGSLGRLYMVHGYYLQDWLLYPTDYNWRVDAKEGGASRAFADIGTHWCDLVEHVTGQRIVRLSAVTHTFIPERVVSDAHTFSASPVTHPVTKIASTVRVQTEDGALVHFETSGGALGSLVISQISAGHKNDIWMEIDGTDAALIWQQAAHEQLWVGKRNDPNSVLHKTPAQLDPGITSFALYPAGHPEGYDDAMGNLFNLVYHRVGELQTRNRAGTEQQPEYPTFSEGAHMLAVVEAVLVSASRDGQWVNI